MLHQRHSTLTHLVIVFIIFLGLAGCSPSAQPTPTPEPVPADVAEVTGTAEALPQVGCKLNLNDYTEAELVEKIPGISEEMIHEFEEYQPYASIENFRSEIGKYVTEADVEAFEQYVYVPVDHNEADTATLMQLPGVDATIAGALIDARPYASKEAFMAALAEHVTPQQLAEASCYLADS
jgi:DNA uptake protein ComE-like DNA-binding protein